MLDWKQGLQIAGISSVIGLQNLYQYIALGHPWMNFVYYQDMDTKLTMRSISPLICKCKYSVQMTTHHQAILQYSNTQIDEYHFQMNHRALLQSISLIKMYSREIRALEEYMVPTSLWWQRLHNHSAVRLSLKSTSDKSISSH